MLIVIAVLAVLALAGGLWLVSGRRRRGRVPPEVSAHKPLEREEALPSASPEEPGEEPSAPGEAAAAPGGARSRARGRALRVVDGA